MATSAPAGAPPGAPARISLQRRVSFALFALLLLLATAFYVYWGLAFDGWFDNGVYAVTIVLALFGLAGMWLVAPNPPRAATADGPA